MRVALEVMPEILCWLMTSKPNVGGMAVADEPFRQ